MVARTHHVDMAITFLIILIAIAVLSVLYGADSRIDDVGRRRRHQVDRFRRRRSR